MLRRLLFLVALLTAYPAHAAIQKKIGDLPDAVALQDIDQIEISRGGSGSYKTTPPQIRANVFSAPTTLTKQISFGAATLTDAATINWDLNTQQAARVTLGGNRTVAAPTNMVSGGQYSLVILQDATGGRTVTWNQAFRWPNGLIPSLALGAGNVTNYKFWSDGTYMYGAAEINYKPGYLQPDLVSTFDTVTANYNKIYDFSFGTGTPPAGATPISNVTQLASYFNAYESGTSTTVINKEWQRYTDFTHGENFVFASDALELTATLNGTLPAGITTAQPTANVTYSRTVNIASATGLKLGQVVSLGPEQYANAHGLQTFSIATPATGEIATLTITHALTASQGGFDPISISATSAGSDASTMAASIVSQINANSTLQTWKVTAYALPGTPGGWAITYPRYSTAGTAEFGTTGKASLSWLTAAIAKTGSSIAVQQPQRLYGVNYIVGISGNTLTLAHPVTATTSSTLTFSPVRLLSLPTTGSATSFTVEDASGIQIGQVVQLSFQDGNLRRITGVNTGTNSITLETSEFMQAGHFMTVYPVYKVVASAASTGTVLTFSGGVPAGVVVGSEVANYGAANPVGDNRVTAVSGTTVTTSLATTAAINDVYLFWPPMQSGQIWSKFNFLPGSDNRDIIAIELTADLPNASVISSWPALWLYTDANDTNPGPNSSVGTSEIDVFDEFTYWNNGTTNNNTLNSWTNATPLYGDPALLTTNPSSAILTGNNIGLKTRKYQFVWTPSGNYFYIDGNLIVARASSVTRYKRMQLGLNLATGSNSTNFNASGFFPIDFSQFPMKYRIRRLRVLVAGSDVPPL